MPQKVNSLLAAGTTSGGVRVRWVRVQVRDWDRLRVGVRVRDKVGLGLG